MRGSVYYQSAELSKVVFKEGAKKEDRINSNHEHYNCVASFNTICLLSSNASSNLSKTSASAAFTSSK